MEFRRPPFDVADVEIAAAVAMLAKRCFELEIASEHLLENSATFVEGENFEAVVAGFVAADVGRVGGFASRMCKSC